jgi:selenocysteine lyase/cysteine desulfurase
MNCQKDKFSLDKDIVYLNSSYMSPLLKRVEKAGIEGLKCKSAPYNIFPPDFFDPAESLKKLFAQLIDTNEPHRIACIPSVSYGIANVTNNIELSPGDEILIIENQFPSNYFSWKRLADAYDAHIKIIAKPNTLEHTARLWNEDILGAISNKTKVVAMCQVHWADGILFDLKAIREKTQEFGALLIIDGTQSVGVYPFSVKDIRPDALICAAYKWLLGPYSFGLGYYGPYFDRGTPIEESWKNRKDSANFDKLADYQEIYKEGAARYSMGEYGNFIAIPMLTESLTQILEWKPEAIQEYCHNISFEALEELQSFGFRLEDKPYRCGHLIGVIIPKSIDIDRMKETFLSHKIYVSFRGNYLRLAPHVYNTREDFDRLVQCIKTII